MLTGSASKGRNSYRVYYHCRSTCGIRYRAQDVNDAFTDELTKFIPRPGYRELFVEGITEACNNQHRAIKEERDLLISQISEANRKIDTARELLLLNELEAGDYRKIKEENGSRIGRLEIRLNELNVQKSNHLNIKKLAQDAVNNLLELDKLYDIATIPAKRYLVGILFPEKFSYSEGTCRTGKLNRGAELIYLENKELRAKKNGAKISFKVFAP